jgi:hypothetical protein
MFKRLNELNFVIGLFFTIIALILLANNLLNKELPGKMNLYTGIVFLIFGLSMIILRTKRSND